MPLNKINQLITYKHLLTDKQKKDILNAAHKGADVHIKPTKVQQGGLLGTLLATVGIPLVIEAIKKMTGHGAPQMGRPKIRHPKNGGLVPYRSPPFIGSWPDQTIGMGKKKNLERAKKAKAYF